MHVSIDGSKQYPALQTSRAALSSAQRTRAMQGGSLYHFYDGLWYDPAV